MRFFAIFFGTLLMFFLVLQMGRQWGLGQTITEFKHPFLEQSSPWAVLQVTDLESAQKAAQAKPDVIFQLPLRVTEQGQFFIQKPTEFETALLEKIFQMEEYKGPKPYFYTFQQLQKKFPHIIKVEDFLNAFPKNRIIFDVIDSAQNVHTQFIKMMKDHSSNRLFLIQSSTDVILKSIKEIEPMWVYGTSYPEINRFLSLNSIGLGPVVQLRSDVYISPLKIQNRPSFTQELNEELRRRKKKILLGPVENEKDLESAKSFDVDGVIFSRLDLLEKSMTQTSK